MFDQTTPEGQALSNRLHHEQVIWLTTVSKNGTPYPTPVWFLWEGESFVIYTLPGSFKLRNIARNPRGSLNLNSDESGGNVAIFTGKFSLTKSGLPALLNNPYLEKYREGIADIEMTPESFSKEYSVLLRFHPERMKMF